MSERTHKTGYYVHEGGRRHWHRTAAAATKRCRELPAGWWVVDIVANKVIAGAISEESIPDPVCLSKRRVMARKKGWTPWWVK